MKRLLALTTCATLTATPTLAEKPYRHAEEKIGTVEQIYDGDLLPDDAVATFRNIDRLFPTRTVPASDKPFPLEPSALKLGPLDLTIKDIEYDLDDVIALNSVTGLLVLKDGKVVTEIYQRGNGPDTRWMSMSLAKSITSTLIGAAIRDGAIKGEDALVTDYVPALKGSAYDGVTVGQILTMTSGVKWDETYTDPASDRRHLLAAQIAQEPGGLMKVMAALPRASEPGTAHTYSTGETQVAGEIVIGATGKPLADYLAEKIWQPYGMEADAKWWLDSPDGHEIGGSGLSATLRDFARFGQFFLDGGKAGGASVLPDGWTERAGLPITLKGGATEEYGMMWWPAWTDQSKAHKAYAAVGIQGQNIYIDPAEHVVIALIAAQPQPLNMEPVDPMAFFDAIVNAIGKE
ncbi:class C beta-lactamase-related serine hydrolase [Paracoccus suum]|uniref:Class C beta-lactamase-related serine hydrolase n=1 Tax=Paracoccus suum TaxID=2259340 RepID=A0A344PIJ7_9RHOB|nr:serine hydrolase [Paracoccus suum]AXC49202.1 class C beta-lactamase-related serine hydrolase [Paracoccus suum]